MLAFMRRRRRPVSTTEVATSLGVTRQAAHRKLRALATEGAIVARGAGRSSRWELSSSEHAFRLSAKGLAEDRVWHDLSATFPALRDDAHRIAAYAFTEMLNNAIEHSGTRTVDVRASQTPSSVVFEVVDRGTGAFETVRAKLRLVSALEALGEISKGKTTTMPDRHSGEGIFFTSKAVQRFELHANGIAWIVDNVCADSTVTPSETKRGTRVRLEVARAPARTLRSVFDEYTRDHEFSRTRTVVRLFAMGTEFVSRSEARRMLARLDRFREVVFDFAHVPAIGQGFADEVFRVWPRAHPAITVSIEHATDEVMFMIRRAVSLIGE